MPAPTPLDTLKSWGETLRTERLRQGLTQAEIATKASIDQATVSRAESGNGSFETVLAIATVLGITVAMGGES